jgi:hypothetical protein
MIDSRVEEIFRDQSQLENNRSTFEAHWKEIAERILPRQDDFMGHRGMEGEKRTEKIFDSTAVLALDRAASAIDSLITPGTQIYHRLSPEDESLEDDHIVKLYLDEVNKLLFKVRYRPMANFASQAHECYVSLMAFGTLGIFIDDVMGSGIRYKSMPLSELFIAENQYGMVDFVHRKFPLTARAAIQKFGTQLPEKILKAAEKEPFLKFDFIHCVKPNQNIQHRRKDFRGMPISSCYVSVEGKKLMSEGGYRTMPYAVSRHVTAPRETYGRSPAMQVLPDIKMLNEMEKTIMRAAHKIVDPPLLAYGDGILSAFNARPNAINYGGVDEQGRQLVHPLKTGSNLPIALEMTEQKRKLINDAFYVTLFQILVQNPQMTATEALIRAQEKGQLLAPTVGRQQSEFLGPTIERELDILSAAGVLPPMPDKLKRVGGGVKAVYTSPLSRLRRAEDGVAIMRTIEAIGPIANVKPEVMDIFDDDALVRELAEINGVPTKILRTPDIVLAIREGRKQQQEQASLLEGAGTAASAAKNMAQAAQAASFIQPATVQ